jgi:hypothetical protein
MAKWQHNPISAKAGAPAAAGKPTGFAWEHDKTQHIVYRGQDNQIHELWFRHDFLSSEWKYGGALSSMTGAPAAAGEPFGYVWEEDKTQHIVYRGVDNNVHELWYKHGVIDNSWKHGGALSARTGGPQAAGNAMGYAWEQDKTQHIVYRSPDNQIQELWFSKNLMGADWKYGGAISAKTGGQPTAGDPFGFSWESDKTQHIIYRGVEGSIHELWFRKELLSAEWKYGGALSAMAGGPQAASDPIGFAWEGDNSQHVVYRGTDNQVHELWIKK